MEIDLGLSFKAIFGYQTDAFSPKVSALFGDVNGKRATTGGNGGAYYGYDLLGREYYLPMEVNVGMHNKPGTDSSYAELLGVTDSSESATGKWNLPYPVISMMDIGQDIVDTKLTDRPGMVSELIQISGYKVNVKGMLIGSNNEYPKRDFALLNRLVNLGTVVTVNNVLTNIMCASLGNCPNTWSLRNLRITGKNGVKHVVGYELDMVTDVAFSLLQIA